MSKQVKRADVLPIGKNCSVSYAALACCSRVDRLLCLGGLPGRRAGFEFSYGPSAAGIPWWLPCCQRPAQRKAILASRHRLTLRQTQRITLDSALAPSTTNRWHISGSGSRWIRLSSSARTTTAAPVPLLLPAVAPTAEPRLLHGKPPPDQGI